MRYLFRSPINNTNMHPLAIIRNRLALSQRMLSSKSRVTRISIARIETYVTKPTHLTQEKLWKALMKRKKELDLDVVIDFNRIFIDDKKA